MSLIPDHILQHLRATLGEAAFDQLGKQEQLILITAHIEKTVDYARMMSILDIHPRDLSTLLASLVEKQLLYQEGSRRGTVYFLAEAMIEDNLLERSISLKHWEKAEPIPNTPGHNSGPLENELKGLANTIASKKRAPGEEVRQVILGLCALRT